jgi:uncharacterized protein (DUF58 family)
MNPRPEKRPVWVWPNRNSIGLAAVLLAMWYAGASQTNGAAYLLCFVLASVVAVSIVHTWANLRGVEVSADPIPPAFVGEHLTIPLLLRTDRHRPHFGIIVQTPDLIGWCFTRAIEPPGPHHASLAVAARKRGFYTERNLRLSSNYPLGFFTASRRATLRQPYYIYPQPAGSRPLPRALAPTRQPRDGLRVAGDDFGGVRTWQPGESQRHIDWKAAARGQALLTKQWTGEAEEILILDWESLAGLDGETRLSQLARWVLLAEHSSASYGLRLPGKEIAPSRGEAHSHECLRALAVFDAPEEVPT